MTNPLVGMHFLAAERCEHRTACLVLQGRVEAEVDSRVFLVRTWGWDAEADLAVCKLVTLDDMWDWVFYATEDDWRVDYQHGAMADARKHREEAHRVRA